MPILYETVYPKRGAQVALHSALLLLPRLGLMKKEIGTTVDFSQAREIALNQFIFQDETFGIYAYQAEGVTIDAATRNNFVNGAMNDLMQVMQTNGMELRYARITWNETLVDGAYWITDLVVGVVAKATSPMNISANRLITALTYTPWYKALISKLKMPWKAWILLIQPSVTQPFNRFNWDAVSAPFQLSSLSGTPSPPSVNETRNHFINDGQVDNAIGQFVKSLVDNGYTVTILPPYRVSIGYETLRVWQYKDRTFAEYKTHTRLSLDFQTNPETYIAGSPLHLTAAIIVAIGKLIALIIVALAVFFALRNLTTYEKSYEKWGWVKNPNTGEWEYRPIETGSEKGPPEWWGGVITTVTIVAILVGAVLIVPRLLPAPKPKVVYRLPPPPPSPPK